MKVFESHYDGDYGKLLCLVAAPNAETAFWLVQEHCKQVSDDLYMYECLSPEVKDGYYVSAYDSITVSHFTEFKEIEGLTYATDAATIVRFAGYIE